MVHLRLNERDTQRNPHINFVRALPGPHAQEATRRLEQIAAVYKPIMASYGFRLNSLEEFPFNREFAGRNWNAGETVELVLRTRDGGWAPLLAVTHVMAHELAHVLHMNHLPAHGRLTSEIQSKVRSLLREGYLGDGFWSAGYRLGDQQLVLGDADAETMVQSYANQVCGGAQRGRVRGRGTRGRGRDRGRGHGAGHGEHIFDRPTASSDIPRSPPNTSTEPKPLPKVVPKRKRGFHGPSLHTGAQTASNSSLAASKRIRKALPGEGQRLDGARIEPPKRGKRAPSTQSPLGRLERLAAIESRLQSEPGLDQCSVSRVGGTEVMPGPMNHRTMTQPPHYLCPKIEPDHEHESKPEAKSISGHVVIQLD